MISLQVRQTLVSLKGAQGTLRLYAAQSKHTEAVSVFKEAIETTGVIIKDLEDRLKLLEFQEPQYKGN